MNSIINDLIFYLGLSIAYLKHNNNLQNSDKKNDVKMIIKFLFVLQNTLYNIENNIPIELDNTILKLESANNYLKNKVYPMQDIILPGGSVVSSSLFICNNLSTKLENKYKSDENRPLAMEVSDLPELLNHDNHKASNYYKFFKLLSDYLFLIARYTNKILGVKDVLWQK